MKTTQIQSDYVSPEIHLMTLSVENGFAGSDGQINLPYSPDAPDYEDGIYF